jgi:hypothetical protein
VPARDLTVTLRGYLAVRLLLERAALDEAARQLSFRSPLSELRGWLGTVPPAPAAPPAIERAWPLFHVAQLCDLDASTRLGLKAREAWTFVALVIALIGLGLAPRPLADSRFAASEEILRLRQDRLADEHPVHDSARDDRRRAAIISPPK